MYIKSGSVEGIGGTASSYVAGGVVGGAGGGTGIGELGLSFALGEEGSFSMDIGAQGFMGKREGVTGSVRAQYAF